MLSMAGKEVLIKSVLQAIPTYAMGCFKLPRNLIRDIESLMAKFWWNDQDHKRVHWLRWESLGLSKKHGGLGFRDLRAFNLAMLAKQAWRLFKNPDSLLGRIYKAKYFPNGDFLSACKGYNPSFSWRGIWEAKILLMNGLRWRVGNGQNIQIWHDRWLPRTPTFRIITPPSGLPSNSTVSNLIDNESGSWNHVLITQLFHPIDADMILSIPLGKSTNQDARIWHYTSNGVFSVKSAYYLALDVQNRERETRLGSSSSASNKSYSFIWKIKVPPKVQMFIWRVCRNLLPSKFNLARRHIIAAPCCEVCDSLDETVLHSLYACHFARQVWALSLIPFSILLYNGDCAEEWMRLMKRRMEQTMYEFYVVCCWYIWYARNQLLFHAKTIPPDELIQRSHSFLAQYRQSLLLNTPILLEHNTSGWVPPPTGWIKINFDTSRFKSEKLTGIGLVARDHTGQSLGWFTKCWNFLTEPVIGEALAAKEACEFAVMKGWNRVMLEGDCLIVINALKTPLPCSANFGVLISDCKMLVEALVEYCFSFVHRKANVPAHTLARHAPSISEGTVSGSELLVSVLSLDSH